MCDFLPFHPFSEPEKRIFVLPNDKHYLLTNMDYLPSDPVILVSSINMLLRDYEFDTLESLCAAFDREPEELKAYLHASGFDYDEQQRRFIGV